MTPLMLGIAAGAVTIAGGLVALRHGDRLWLLSGLAAGIVLGVALFDLLPEAVALGVAAPGLRLLTITLATGFMAYLLVDRGTAAWSSGGVSWRDHLAPATLALHSLVDGLGIGLAFQMDARAGWLIAMAVLAHDVADGVNTVGLCLAARAEGAARVWLAVNSLMPLAGVLVGQQLRVASGTLALVLAGFAGAFLYIGACELIPRSRALDPQLRTAVATVAGMMLMAGVTGLAR